MNIKQFNLLAQNDPLAITDDMVFTAEKKARYDNKLLKYLFVIGMTLLALPAAIVIVAALTSLLAVVVFNSELTFSWVTLTLSNTLGVMVAVMVGTAIAIACTVRPLSCSKNRNDNTLAMVQPLSALQGNECAQVVALCYQSSSAKNFRNTVIENEQELRIMHLLYMQKMVGKENALQENETRRLACRAAHGIPSTNSRPAHTPFVALGVLALAAILFNR